MTTSLIITAVVMLLAASSAMCLRNLVHCVLALAVSFAGIAAFYLQLDAEFVGFAEILVYVGAIAILIVFAILLTRSGDAPEKSMAAPGWYWGIAISALVFSVIGWAVLHSAMLPKEISPAPDASVKKIGEALMTKYVLPLEIIGLVLTAAMIGAVLIALREVTGSAKAEKAATVPAALNSSSATEGKA